MKYHRVIQYSLDYVGARKFLVGTLEQFYEIYSHLDEIHRHHYETIQSTWFYTGKPCNLYFDVEFERNLNPNAKGDAMVTIFVQFVSEFLHRRYDFEGLDVVDLESSSDTKFSRHLIFRIHKARFENNVKLGWLVQELVFELELARSAGETLFPTDLTVHDIEELFVMGKSGSSVLFIDLGVYTKNRNFRLLGSAKLGKLVHLTDTSNTEMDFDRFRKSLVCDDEMNCTILKIAEASLPISHGHQSIRHMPCHIFNDATEVVRYPQIESELISHMNKLSEGTPSIKSRVYRENMIILAVTNHRYCFNAGRSHQSNGIFYIVDLVKRIFYQKCHDPDCRGFRSNDFPLGDTTLHDCPPRQLL